MKYDNFIKAANENNGLVTSDMLSEIGISRSTLYNWIKSGKIFKISKGIYSYNDEIPDIMYILQRKCPMGVFSHESALYLHGYSDRTPDKHVMTIPHSYNASRLKDDPVSFKYINPNLLDLGKIKLRSPQGNWIYIYDIERTICDIIKHKESMDISIVNSALRDYMLQSNAKLTKISLYAKKMNVDRKVRNTLEVLL